MVKVKVNNIIYEYKVGTSLLEISETFKDEFKFEILVGQVNGDMHSLNYKVMGDSTVRFFDLSSHIGNKVYERGLIFMLIKAVKETLNVCLRIRHSIDKGIYCEVTTGSIKEDDIKIVKDKLMEYVSASIPFKKGNYSKDDVATYYSSIGRMDKVESLRYVMKDSLVLYNFLDMMDYFYGVMPINSSYIKYFDITYLDNKSIVLLLPNIYLDGNIKPYTHNIKVLDSFRNFSLWGETQGIINVHDLNREITHANIQDLIYMNETNQNIRLFEIAKQIKEKKDAKIILIAGPSSSGKTTTSKKLSIYLKSLGLKPQPLSVDDYFKEREDSPRDKDGNFDFECVEAIDIELFNSDLKKLLNNEEVLIPTFNFIEGKKEFKNKIKLDENGILIIEGLHALNDVITSSIDNKNKFKM